MNGAREYGISAGFDTDDIGFRPRGGRRLLIVFAMDFADSYVHSRATGYNPGIIRSQSLAPHSPWRRAWRMTRNIFVKS